MNTKRQALSVDTFKNTLTINFSNGEALELNTDNLSPEIRHAAMMHGLKQKLVDAAAMSRNADNLNSNQVDAKFAAVREVYNRLTSATPSWNKEKASVSAPVGSKSMLIEAIVRLNGNTHEYVEQFLNDKTKAQVAALKQNPKILAEIAKIKAEQEADTTEADELLADLGIGDDSAPDETPVDASPSLAQIAAQMTNDHTAAPTKRTRAKKTVEQL